MNLSTKFDLGQIVWPIVNGRIRTWIVCVVCGGTGQIRPASTDKAYTCPECHGHREQFGDIPNWHQGPAGAYKSEPTKWIVQSPTRIGSIRIERYHPELSHERFKDEDRYMLQSTGIGSGGLHAPDRLYASQEEAQAVCDEWNKEAQ